LTALAQLGPESVRGLGVRAVHIDHGLQSASVCLREASAALCRRLQIPLAVITVAVDSAAGVSLEAAARNARYRAFALELRAGECLLTAHHAQDQAETLLLQLLRGAGLKGLSAMPMCRPFAPGWHLRPLLNVARRDLRAFAQAHEVTAVEDPMNCDPRFDRAWPPLSRARHGTLPMPKNCWTARRFSWWSGCATARHCR
jgi:tRNA(Ile)-lysidine synthase